MRWEPINTLAEVRAAKITSDRIHKEDEDKAVEEGIVKINLLIADLGDDHLKKGAWFAKRQDIYRGRDRIIEAFKPNIEVRFQRMTDGDDLFLKWVGPL